MYHHKHWFLSRHTLAGMGLGALASTIIYVYWNEVSLLSALKVGVIGTLLFMYGKGRKHHGYYINHHKGH